MKKNEATEDPRSQLSHMSFHCTQESGTEPAFTGAYLDEKRPGVYRCVVCKAALFDSETKYDSRSGWPSFWKPAASGAINTRHDNTQGILRIETLCAACGAHLGHVFPDGPQPTGDRFCINSACLVFEPSDRGEG